MIEGFPLYSSGQNTHADKLQQKKVLKGLKTGLFEWRITEHTIAIEHEKVRIKGLNHVNSSRLNVNANLLLIADTM